MGLILNNINGFVCEIANIENNSVSYKIYENSLKRKILSENTEVFIIDEIFLPETILNIKQIKEQLAYNSLQIEGFILSEDLQNWLMPTKIKRLTILNSFILDELEKNSPISQIIKGIIELNAYSDPKFIFKAEHDTVVYLEEIYPEHLALMQEFLGNQIILEQKN